MHYLFSTRAHEYNGSIHPTMQSVGGMKEMQLFVDEKVRVEDQRKIEGPGPDFFFNK